MRWDLKGSSECEQAFARLKDNIAPRDWLASYSVWDGDEKTFDQGVAQYPGPVTVTFTECNCNGNLLECWSTCPIVGCGAVVKWRFVVEVNCFMDGQLPICVEEPHRFLACVCDKNVAVQGGVEHTHN